MAPHFVRLNFVKYDPIFKILFVKIKKNCNYTVTKDSTTLQVCRYTALLNVCRKSNKISLTTHCKKLTTENNFFVSVIV